jgi:hypothetical protein
MRKPIQGYEGKYEIDKKGNVYSLPRFHNKKENVIKVFKHNGRCCYASVWLWKNNKRKSFLLHKLIADNFIPNPKKLPQVNHKDGNKMNFEINNLEWCTSSENNLHSFRVLGKKPTMKGKFGIEHHTSIPIIQFDKNMNFINKYYGAAEAQRKTGICRVNIRSVVKGKYKTAGGFIWQNAPQERIKSTTINLKVN